MTATTGRPILRADTGSATRASKRQTNRPASTTWWTTETGRARGVLSSGIAGTTALGAAAGWAGAPLIRVVDIVTGSIRGIGLCGVKECLERARSPIPSGKSPANKVACLLELPAVAWRVARHHVSSHMMKIESGARFTSGSCEWSAPKPALIRAIA